MKKVLFLFVCTLFSLSTAFACDFEFSTDGNMKAVKAGDEMVVNVKLSLTHRVCKVAAKDTKFKTEGMKVLGATDWKEEGPGVFTRRVKVKVLDGDAKEVSMSATRTCDKEGGFGVFTLPKK